MPSSRVEHEFGLEAIDQEQMVVILPVLHFFIHVLISPAVRVDVKVADCGEPGDSWSFWH